MKTSVCITVFNEEKTIDKLLRSIAIQLYKADQIVIVDAKSSDKTVDIIRHFQKKDKRIRLIIQKCSRAQGRNLAVEIAKNEIIAMTDAGCVPKNDWLKHLTGPFKNGEVDISAGFYDMVGDRPVQKALSVYLGVLPSKFDINFLPSTRSVAFRKKAWEKIGGFPEKLKDTAEDTVFNYKAVAEGLRIARVKNARVEWEMPSNLAVGIKKMFFYAKGDAKTGIWRHPVKKYSSHNIKVLSIFARYILGFYLLILGLNNPFILSLILLFLFLYIFWVFRKVYIEFRDWRAGFWGIILQFASDFAVMGGFIAGIIGK